MLSKKIFFFRIHENVWDNKKNCDKCDLETIFTNDSQYFWINLKDFEVETKHNWQNNFNKHGNSTTLKYRKELAPHIQFQSD